MHTGPTSPRIIDQPQPGFFRLRLVKRGWQVPARIIHEGGLWRAVVDGTEHPPAADPHDAPWVMRLWQGAEITDEADYRWRDAIRTWAREHCPNHPAARPEEPINGLTIPLLPYNPTRIPL